jgi:hypothetical protein
VLELAATSPKMTSCDGGLTTNCTINGTAKGGDLRYVGVASTAPQAVADGVPEDSMLGFGLATWSNWYNLGVNTVPFVDIDVGADGTYDYETFVIRDIDTDLLEAWTVSLEAGFPLVDIEPINTVYDDVDSNKFDSNVMVMPVFLDALGIDPTDPSARLNYFVGVDGYYEPLDDTLVDYIDAELTFDPLQPGAWVEGTGGPALVFNGVNGTSLVVHRNPAALALDGSNSLLVLHHHNRSGSRAQVVPVL